MSPKKSDSLKKKFKMAAFRLDDPKADWRDHREAFLALSWEEVQELVPDAGTRNAMLKEVALQANADTFEKLLKKCEADETALEALLKGLRADEAYTGKDDPWGFTQGNPADLEKKRKALKKFSAGL